MKEKPRISYPPFLCFFLFLPSLLPAQEQPPVNDSLRRDAVHIFIDCEECDMNYIRREIPYVNYVRDVREAEVYVLETSQSTGSGGTKYTFTFHGQRKFQGKDDTLVYACRPDDTEDYIREGRTNMLKLGLMRYVARTPLASKISIHHSLSPDNTGVVDKWNYWVFEINTYPGFEGEESVKEFNMDNSFRISKITDKWKLEFDLDHDIRNDKYNFKDTTYKAFRSSLGMDNLIVKSLTDHWSAGVRFDVATSTFSNIHLGYDIYPSIEYNIFPYSQSTHKQLRLLYGAGFNYFHYNDSTIYNKIKEKLFSQRLAIAYQVKEKWGSINLSLSASSFFHDFRKNRIEMDGYITFRIFKGLSFEIWGEAARIRDQLSLAKGDLEPEEVLLELRELATGYNFDFGFGFTYTFGSIYSNIVNPRFGNHADDWYD